MSLGDTVKILKRASARVGLFISWRIIARLPYKAVKTMANILTSIGFCLTIKLKRSARESLNIAFGAEKSREQVNTIVRACFRNLGQAMVDLIYYSEHPDEVKEKFIIEGKEYLDQALEKGKGVVAVTAHFGNFPLMQLALAQYGYKVNVIMRKARDKKIAERVCKTMASVGVKSIYSIPARACVQNSLQVLRDNEILFVLLDQNFGSSSGVFVDFFGRKAATGTGPIVFADRAKSPILPIFNIRENGDRYKIIIEPPLELEARDSKDEMLFVNVSRITNIIEQYIRKYPHEWGWMHRRWKSKPVERNT